MLQSGYLRWHLPFVYLQFTEISNITKQKAEMLGVLLSTFNKELYEKNTDAIAEKLEENVETIKIKAVRKA